MSTDIADPARPSAAPAAGGGPRAPKRAPNRLLLGAAGVAGFLLLWEAVPRLGIIPGRFLPPASEVLLTLGERVLLPEFWIAVWDTLVAWGLGLAIAFAAAVVLGFVVGAVPALRRFTSSTVEFLRPIPSVALIPLAILLYGTDLASTLMLVIYAAFWQIYIQVLYGVGDIDPVAEQTARSYGLGRFARLRYVAWPSALPYLLTGLRLGASVALILAVTGQLIIGTPGLGEQIAVAQASGATALVYALIIATGALGVAVNVGLRALERRALRWHVSVRGEEIA
ncbi:ABC transporter permease [Streptomonospora sp. S1-112]|uniref:ABC transporter permease n=1 Tax=Streptomonospora mangrovi TaxID=2883123 RepID=A0A9X3SGF4_9ACTN|nr:ABC transporter permease [Streptomonospora mangrovi]MDA0564089.1 ABC transporter permease [Streptomonospora mangrovi]